MHASAFQEQKLHFRSFLNTTGRSLLTAMAVARRASTNDVLASLDSAVDLEFYMPVRQQRARWRGEPVIVATALRDHELPSAYDNQGNVVPILSPDIPPAGLALALVPVETDFNVAPAVVSGGSGIHASTTSGTCPPDACLTYAYVPGDWEGWLMGQPEFETHVFVRQTDSSIAYHQVCAGADSHGHYYDQNNAYWTGSVELLSYEELQALREHGSSLLIQVWEDDTEPCTIRKDPQWLAGVWALARSFFGGYTSADIVIRGWDDVCHESSSDEQACWVALVQAVFAPFDVFSAFNDDDYVGEFVPAFMAGGCYNGNYAIVAGNGGYAGCANVSGVVLIPPPAPPPPPLSANISGPDYIDTKGTYTWTANGSGGSGGYTYEWQVTYLSTGTTYVLGSAQSQSLTVYSGDGQFEMSLRVTSNGSSVLPTLTVQECIAPCAPPP